MQCATVCDSVFTTFISTRYYLQWINMIQRKTIAMLMIAIATVGVIGTTGLLVQHANAASVQSVCVGSFRPVCVQTHSSSIQSLRGENAPDVTQSHTHSYSP